MGMEKITSIIWFTSSVTQPLFCGSYCCIFIITIWITVHALMKPFRSRNPAWLMSRFVNISDTMGWEN